MGNHIPSLHSLMLLLLLGTSAMVHAVPEDKAGALHRDGHHQINPLETPSGTSDGAESRQLLARLQLGLGATASPSLQALDLAGINPSVLGLGPAGTVLANPLLAQQLAINRIGIGLENSPSVGTGLAGGGLPASKLGAGQSVAGLGTSGLGAGSLDAIGLGPSGAVGRSLGIGPGTAPGVLNPALASVLGGRPIIPALAPGQLANPLISDLLKLAPYLSSEDWKEILDESRSGLGILNSHPRPFNVATDRKGDEEIKSLAQALQSLQKISPIAAGAGLPLGSPLQGPALANPLLQRLLTANALQLANARALQMMALAREPYLAAQKRSLELSSPSDISQRYPSSPQKFSSQEYYGNPYHNRRRYDHSQEVSSGFIEISSKPSSSDRNYFPRRSTHEYRDRYTRRDHSFKFPRDV